MKRRRKKDKKKISQNSALKMGTKLTNLNCDKTGNSNCDKTKNNQNDQKSNFDKTPKLWQNLKKKP